MARIRTVKPEFWAHPKVARVSRDARLLFLGLLNEADDEGRMRFAPKRIAGVIFPEDVDVDAGTVERWTAELEQVGLVLRYSVDGAPLLLIPGFTEHQRINRPTDSILPEPPAVVSPPPPLTEDAVSPHTQLSEPSLPERNRERNREQGKERKSEVASSASDDATTLALHLAQSIGKNGAKVPKRLDAWIKEIDRMIRLDERDPIEIRAVITWATNDSFWKANMLSADSLRKQFDRLNILRKAPRNGRTPNNTRESYDAAAAEFLARHQ